MDTPKKLHLHPQISEESVRAALNALVYSTTERETDALETLCLVDDWLDDPTHPPSPQIRWYALQSILMEIIASSLCAHRSALGLPLPTPEDSYTAALAQIDADGQTGNIELLCWSWLYYRYVRVDLDVNGQVFAGRALTGDRTLRRYQQHAVRRLTERLLMLEHAARRRRVP